MLVGTKCQHAGKLVLRAVESPMAYGRLLSVYQRVCMSEKQSAPRARVQTPAQAALLGYIPIVSLPLGWLVTAREGMATHP